MRDEARGEGLDLAPRVCGRGAEGKTEGKTEAKAREKEPPEAKPREKEAAQNRAREKDDKETVAAQVRAALANVDASRPASTELPAPPRPLEAPLTTGAIGAPPRAGDVVLPPPQPAPPTPLQPAPVAPNPLVSVEIKSRPVANAAGMPAADGVQPEGVPEEAKGDKGLLATIKRIPALLRPGAGATTNEPPRPPLPVDEQ